jgi:hypothetical protein
MAPETLNIEHVVDEIVNINRQFADFWSHAHGWAPPKTADLLSKSRLDRQISLSACLRIWLRKPPDGQRDGHLILAWTNLGTLIEGSMKFFLCVFAGDYANNPVLDRKKNPLDPDVLPLEVLRQFFLKHVWTAEEKKLWSLFVEKVQQRRNAIHAYKDRNIGNRMEFKAAIRKYFEFISEIKGMLPYPSTDIG